MKNFFLNIFKGIDVSLFVILAFSLLPLIPNRIKGFPVVLMVLVTLVFLISKKADNKNYIKYGVFFSSLFLLYLVSLIYTNNIEYGLKKIETTASLLIIPICFAFIYQRVEIRAKIKTIFIHGYILTSTIYAISILWYFNYLGIHYCENNLSHCLSYLDGMFILSEHPIYASMFIALGAIFISNIVIKQNIYIKLLYAVCLIIICFVLFLLMRKGVILALMVSFISFFIFNRKYVKMNYLILTFSLCVIIILSFNFKESFYKRFSELVSQDTYEVISQKNSTSIRYTIYKCSLFSISKSPLIGYGIGDVIDELIKCYENESNLLVKERYNSHNQFLAVILYIGVIGLAVFVWQILLYFKSAIFNRDTLYFQVLLFFIFLFFTENILDRQSGVILFSFIVNFFFFNNLRNKHGEISND